MEVKSVLLGSKSEEYQPRSAALHKRVLEIEDEETRNYLLDRVLPQIEWYGRKTARYRGMYYRLTATTILMGALIPPFCIGANNSLIKVIIAFLGTFITAINTYVNVRNYRALSITYRMARENLIRILYSYFNHAGVFSSAENSTLLLVNACEDTLSNKSTPPRFEI